MMPADGKEEETLALFQQALVAGEKEAAQKQASERTGLTLTGMTEAESCLYTVDTCL